MSSEPSLNFRHVPQLDGIRAIAVLIVMISHGGLGKYVPGGFGVTIFFFLSGYLITSLLRVEVACNGRVDFKAFYIRRTLRIMPPLYVTLVILTAMYLAGVFEAHGETSRTLPRTPASTAGISGTSCASTVSSRAMIDALPGGAALVILGTLLVLAPRRA